MLCVGTEQLQRRALQREIIEKREKMELLTQFIDIFIHLDVYLNEIISQYGAWTYGILFAVIFVETGFVIMPFLPGDSLLFAAGALAALEGSVLNIWLMIILLMTAAILGKLIGHYPIVAAERSGALDGQVEKLL